MGLFSAKILRTVAADQSPSKIFKCRRRKPTSCVSVTKLSYRHSYTFSNRFLRRYHRQRCLRAATKERNMKGIYDERNDLQRERERLKVKLNNTKICKLKLKV